MLLLSTGPDPLGLVAPAPPQGGVGAVAFDEFVVGSKFGDLPAVDDRDPVGVVGGVEAVGDGDNGSAVDDGR